MFKPTQVIFAPTSRCNLVCPHCRVSRILGELSAAEAAAFLPACAEGGIERVGFSGGEPFLRPDFLCDVSRAAVDSGLYFDRLMTNGSWFESRDELETVLRRLFESGFDGTFGLSFDAYHGQDPGKLAEFLGGVFRVWSRKDCAEILSVRSPDDGPWLGRLSSLAELLGGRLVLSEGEPRAVSEREPRREEAAAGEILDLPVLRFPYSASAGEDAWGSARWFREDFCEGPGNVFYVHPDGSVAVCCGFANENPSLIVGNIREDDYSGLLRKASESPHVRLCYEKGLDRRRRELEARGVRFPGKTDDPCFFCDWLSRNGMLED